MWRRLQKWWILRKIRVSREKLIDDLWSMLTHECTRCTMKHTTHAGFQDEFGPIRDRAFQSMAIYRIQIREINKLLNKCWTIKG